MAGRASYVSLRHLDRLDAVEAAEWQRRIARTHRPCGCKSGALLTVVALVGWPIVVAYRGAPDTPLEAALAACLYVFVVIASGALGKVAGIATGRAHNRWLVHSLRRRLSRVGAERSSDT